MHRAARRPPCSTRDSPAPSCVEIRGHGGSSRHLRLTGEVEHLENSQCGAPKRTTEGDRRYAVPPIGFKESPRLGVRLAATEAENPSRFLDGKNRLVNNPRQSTD